MCAHIQVEMVPMLMMQDESVIKFFLVGTCGLEKNTNLGFEKKIEKEKKINLDSHPCKFLTHCHTTRS